MMNIYANEILNYEDQINFKKAFAKEFIKTIPGHENISNERKENIEKSINEMFYFDNVFLVYNCLDYGNKMTGRTVRGVALNKSTCAEMTAAIMEKIVKSTRRIWELGVGVYHPSVMRKINYDATIGYYVNYNNNKIPVHLDSYGSWSQINPQPWIKEDWFTPYH